MYVEACKLESGDLVSISPRKVYQLSTFPLVNSRLCDESVNKSTCPLKVSTVESRVCHGKCQIINCQPSTCPLVDSRV